MGKFVFFLILIAVAIYLLVRIIERRGIQRRRGSSGPISSSGPAASNGGPLGPDDDPDFIWGLNKKRRHPDDPDTP